MSVFVIAEAACTWLYGDDPLKNAKRSIEAAKDCGANAWKTQWTSDPRAMAERRKKDADYSRLAWDKGWHSYLKEACVHAGIEYMCTVFLPKDICTISEYVKRAKISAFESGDRELMRQAKAHFNSIIASYNHDCPVGWGSDFMPLYCVSEYPTPLGKLKLGNMRGGGAFIVADGYCGLSDHTTSVLTGAVAVGAGAKIIEKHVRLHDTPPSDPDYGHSLLLDCGSQDAQGDWGCEGCMRGFHRYVEMIREAEEMMG